MTLATREGEIELVTLHQAARQAQLRPAQLLELALRDPRLKLFIGQAGWAFDAHEDDGNLSDGERERDLEAQS